MLGSARWRPDPEPSGRRGEECLDVACEAGVLWPPREAARPVAAAGGAGGAAGPFVGRAEASARAARVLTAAGPDAVVARSK